MKDIIVVLISLKQKQDLNYRGYIKYLFIFKYRLQRRDSLHVAVEEEHESFVYHPLQIFYRQLIKHNF